MRAIAEKVRSRNGILIADEAHGAHFAFHDYFPETAVAQGADIVINSLHKTLPAVSGCAVLHTNRNFPKLRFFINAMQTTSPSYMLMAGVDYMLDRLTPCLFDEYVQRLEKFRNKAALSHFTKLVDGENYDRGKLLFSLNTSAEQVSEIAVKEYGIQFEMARGRHLLAMTSVADTDEGFLRLEKFLGGKYLAAHENLVSHEFTLPEIVLTPRDAMRHKSEEIPSNQAIGRISAELIADYPPGIATIVPGERINTLLKKPLVRVLNLP